MLGFQCIQNDLWTMKLNSLLAIYCGLSGDWHSCPFPMGQQKQGLFKASVHWWAVLGCLDGKLCDRNSVEWSPTFKNQSIPNYEPYQAMKGDPLLHKVSMVLEVLEAMKLEKDVTHLAELLWEILLCQNTNRWPHQITLHHHIIFLFASVTLKCR